MKRLGVAGWPVAHSRSPALQNAALAAAGLDRDWHYQLLPIPPELFEETVLALPADGFRGLNVTLPYKARALALATEASQRAQAIGAANTLVFRADGSIYAENTDAIGFINELERIQPVSGARALVLGAGGTARAALWALLDAHAAQVQVWNRTATRAEDLCSEIGGTPVTDLSVMDPADVIVNATSVGLHDGDSLSDLPITQAMITKTACVVDFVYRERGTPLAAAARAAGVPSVDGLQLLAAQGAPAFELFTGHAADVSVLAAIRAALGLSSAP